MARKWRMEDVKVVGFVFSVLILLIGCSSTPIVHADNPNQSYAIDSALFEGSKYLASRMPIKSKVAVVNIQSPANNLTNYIIDSLLMRFVNEGKFILIERSDLNLLEKEQRYQLSGMVSDETAASIGKQLGTQFIISGSMLPLGDRYSLKLKVINVETAQVAGNIMYQVKTDETLLALLKIDTQNTPTAVTKDERKQEQPKTIINNNTVNITNNNETTIHGDVYINAPKGFGGF